MNGTNLCHRIINLKVKKIDVLKEVNRRGVRCYPSRFSDILNENYPCLTESIVQVLNTTDKILTEWEERKENNYA